MEFSKEEIEYFLEEARKEALKSNCERRKGGSVIVNEGKIIGRGFNSPPKNLESQRRCIVDKNNFDKKVTDKTCCLHAEERAIIDALKKGHSLNGSFMFFTSVDEYGQRLPSGKPYCTICSKLALDTGVSNWVLEHEEEIRIYDSEEYNNISFNYH